MWDAKTFHEFFFFSRFWKERRNHCIRFGRKHPLFTMSTMNAQETNTSQGKQRIHRCTVLSPLQETICVIFMPERKGLILLYILILWGLSCRMRDDLKCENWQFNVNIYAHFSVSFCSIQYRALFLVMSFFMPWFCALVTIGMFEISDVYSSNQIIVSLVIICEQIFLS